MSSNKHFLRVTNDWTKIAEPDDKSNYFANVSGISIQCVFSDDAIEDTTAINTSEVHPFTVGGTISQLCTYGKKYVYARALELSETEQAAIVIDAERMPVDDVANIQEEVQTIAVELMKLTKRVNTNRLDNIDHAIDYELFIRQFIDSTAAHHLQFTALHKHIATIWEELFLAEKYIQQHRSDYASLKDVVEHIKTNGTGGSSADSEEVQKLRDEVANVILSVTDCTNLVDSLKKQVQTNTDNITDINTEELPPIKTAVNKLSDNLAALNNAFVQLTTNHTVTEINDIFNDLVVSVPSESIGTVTAIRNFIIDIINSKTALSAIDEDTSILTNKDTIILDGDDKQVIDAISS